MFRVEAVLLVIHLLLLIAYALVARDWHLNMRLGCAVLLDTHICVALFLVALHLRDQISDSRSSLMPGYVFPHIVIAAGVVLFLTIMTAIVQYYVLSLSFSGSLAIITIISSVLAFFAYTLHIQWPFVILLNVGTYIGLDSWIIEIVARGIQGYEWSFWAIGVMCYGWLVKCLVDLRKEESQGLYNWQPLSSASGSETVFAIRQRKRREISTSPFRVRNVATPNMASQAAHIPRRGMFARIMHRTKAIALRIRIAAFFLCLFETLFFFGVLQSGKFFLGGDTASPYTPRILLVYPFSQTASLLMILIARSTNA